RPRDLPPAPGAAAGLCDRRQGRRRRRGVGPGSRPRRRRRRLHGRWLVVKHVRVRNSQRKSWRTTMRQTGQTSKLFAAGLCALWLCLGGPVSPAPAMTITPTAPAISVGQTQQFTASGALAPTAVSAGGEYTCVTLPDGT